MSGSGTKYITLVLTHQCNLRCRYCYEKHKDNCTMSYDVAKNIIEKELNLLDKYSIVQIDLFGGEPFLEFDLIKKIVDYSRKCAFKKKFYFFITTNGCLLSDEIKKWLRDNTDLVQLSLSLDGTKKMQDINRCNSFDKIDLSFFKTTYPEQTVKMTISNETLRNMAEGVIFLHSRGFGVSCNLAYGIDWSDLSNVNALSSQLKILIDFYLKNPSIESCSMLDVRRLINVSRNSNTNSMVCGVGRGTKAFDYDGHQYPCQHFLPISIGVKQARNAAKIKFYSEEIPDYLMDRQCAKCVVRNICMTCYGANYAATGNIFKHDENMCKLFKIQFKALSYFAIKKFVNHQFDDLGRIKTASILKSALMIDKELV